MGTSYDGKPPTIRTSTLTLRPRSAGHQSSSTSPCMAVACSSTNSAHRGQSTPARTILRLPAMTEIGGLGATAAQTAWRPVVAPDEAIHLADGRLGAARIC